MDLTDSQKMIIGVTVLALAVAYYYRASLSAELKKLMAPTSGAAHGASMATTTGGGDEARVLSAPIGLPQRGARRDMEKDEGGEQITLRNLARA